MPIVAPTFVVVDPLQNVGEQDLSEDDEPTSRPAVKGLIKSPSRNIVGMMRPGSARAKVDVGAPSMAFPSTSITLPAAAFANANPPPAKYADKQEESWPVVDGALDLASKRDERLRRAQRENRRRNSEAAAAAAHKSSSAFGAGVEMYGYGGSCVEPVDIGDDTAPPTRPYSHPSRDSAHPPKAEAPMRRPREDDDEDDEDDEDGVLPPMEGDEADGGSDDEGAAGDGPKLQVLRGDCPFCKEPCSTPVPPTGSVAHLRCERATCQRMFGITIPRDIKAARPGSARPGSARFSFSRPGSARPGSARNGGGGAYPSAAGADEKLGADATGPIEVPEELNTDCPHCKAETSAPMPAKGSIAHGRCGQCNKMFGIRVPRELRPGSARQGSARPGSARFSFSRPGSARGSSSRTAPTRDIWAD